jgi:hypothetical protein
VLNVFCLTKQLISNSASAGSACGKFFAADHHRFMRGTMTIEMPDEVNATHRGEFAGFAQYWWGFVGSHRTSISENHIRNTETRGTSARGRRRNVRCLTENYHNRRFTVLLVILEK